MRVGDIFHRRSKLQLEAWTALAGFLLLASVSCGPGETPTPTFTLVPLQEPTFTHSPTSTHTAVPTPTPTARAPTPTEPAGDPGPSRLFLTLQMLPLSFRDNRDTLDVVDVASETPGDDNGTVMVNTIEDARVAAGYQVSGPTFLPDGFARGVIFVDTHAIQKHINTVTQWWVHDGDGSSIELFQTPGLIRLAEEGSPVTIRGAAGERVLYPTIPGRPFEVLSVFWNDGDTGFLVTGTLTGSLTEDLIMRVAESVASN